MNKRISKGFTLIEIIIILVISGTLGAFITFMNVKAEHSAQAVRIIHSFRNFRNAAKIWENEDAQGNDAIIDYLKSKAPANLTNGVCMFQVADDGKSLYVGYNLSDDEALRDKLTAKAQAAELLGSDMKTLYNNDSQVWVKVL